MATVDGDILLQNLVMDDNDLFIMEPELTLPMLSLDVEIVILDAELTLPCITIEVEAGISNGAEGDCLLPNVSGIEFEGGTGVYCDAELSLPHISIEVDVGIQNLVDAEIALPNLTIEVETAHACTVDAELTLPDIILEADVLTVIAETFETWVINAVTFAHANYSNYGFNSFIELNGTVYGLDSSGIHALTGSTDNGTAISASAKWGVVNLGTDQKKIVDGGYLHCRMAESLVVGLAAEEGTRYPYTATDHGKAGIHAERWKAAKGIKGVFFQPDIANVSGSDFDFAQLDLSVNKLQRRAG